MGIWKISESWQELFDLLINKEAYYPDLKKIQADKRKQEWLATRLLLQHLSGGDTYISYQKNGAPFLPGRTDHISISHTQGFAAVLLSKSPHPGVDIEYHSERAWRLRKKYMNERELTFIMSLSDHKSKGNALTTDETEIATICWCAKETAYKALGETEVDFSEHLRIEPFCPAKEGILILNERRTEQKRSFKINYRVTDDFILTMHT
ncbi:MAG: 4'-phosphopantetheinyl transferase superfamily protein [Tannerella sp.]|jgi:phosphopantetheinyl transferase|nr:4'-phosphopantetheinyl transferase superfamily protein [Tannerella sp.]